MVRTSPASPGSQPLLNDYNFCNCKGCDHSYDLFSVYGSCTKNYRSSQADTTTS